jgi:hypothetical protein
VSADRNYSGFAVSRIGSDPGLGALSCSTASQWYRRSYLPVPSAAGYIAQKEWFRSLVAASVGYRMVWQNSLAARQGHKTRRLVGTFVPHLMVSVADA